MSEPTTVRMGALAAYLSLALALSAQGGAAIWWAGTHNTRMTSLEARVAELLSTSPLYHNQVVEADRRIAVIDERIANILARIEALTAALERRHDAPDFPERTTAMQTTDPGCLTLIRHEGVVPGPYLDVKDIWTFGIGHTAAAGPPDPARMPRGMPADLEAGIREAFQLFRSDLATYEAEVLRAVKVPLEPHELDALVSFHYNTGGIAKAALTRHLNAGNRAAAAAAFMGWLRPAAIRSRREAERDLFARGIYPTGTIPVWSVDRNGRVDFSRPIRRLTETEALTLLPPTGTPKPPPA